LYGPLELDLLLPSPLLLLLFSFFLTLGDVLLGLCLLSFEDVLHHLGCKGLALGQLFFQLGFVFIETQGLLQTVLKLFLEGQELRASCVLLLFHSLS
jgi:hypothetical protein